MINNIIFDWSGVINNNRQLVVKVINSMLAEYKVKPISQTTLRNTWIQPYMLFYRRYIPKLSLKEEQRLYEKYNKLYKPKYPSKDFPQIAALIKKLSKSGKNLIVISSDGSEGLNNELKQYGLTGLFNRIYSNVHDKQIALNKILKNKKVVKSQTIFIGDSIHEVDCGNKSGIKTIGVTWGFSSPKLLAQAKPTFICHNVKQLEKILLD